MAIPTDTSVLWRIPEGATLAAYDNFDALCFLRYNDGALEVYDDYSGWILADDEYFTDPDAPKMTGAK